jgi:hypothetical protein
MLGRATGNLEFIILTTSLVLGEATTFPFIVYSTPLHEAHIQMGIPKFPKLGVQRLWGPVTLCVDLWLKWGLKQSSNLRQELFHSIWHATWTQGNWVDSRLLVIGNQITNLTCDLSFGHKLCFRSPNGLRDPILDIFVLITFQWYKKLFNPMGFDPYNFPLKIWESQSPKMGVHLGVWGFIPSHSFALPRAWYVSLGLPSWPKTLQALALVASLKLRLQQKTFQCIQGHELNNIHIAWVTKQTLYLSIVPSAFVLILNAHLELIVFLF